MAIKRTHIYRGHAIVHQVFSSEQTEDKIEHFIVSQPGKSRHVCTKATLEEAKASVDEVVSASSTGYAANSA